MYSRRRFGSRSLTLGFTFGRNIRSGTTNGSVNLKTCIEEKLAARAKAEGLTTEEFVNRELQKLVATRPPEKLFALTASPEEWVKTFQEWVHTPRPIHPPLSDDAISRESIYREREDAQL